MKNLNKAALVAVVATLGLSDVSMADVQKPGGIEASDKLIARIIKADRYPKTLEGMKYVLDIVKSRKADLSPDQFAIKKTVLATNGYKQNLQKKYEAALAEDKKDVADVTDKFADQILAVLGKAKGLSGQQLKDMLKQELYPQGIEVLEKIRVFDFFGDEGIELSSDEKKMQTILEENEAIANAVMELAHPTNF